MQTIAITTMASNFLTPIIIVNLPTMKKSSFSTRFGLILWKFNIHAAHNDFISLCSSSPRSHSQISLKRSRLEGTKRQFANAKNKKFSFSSLQFQFSWHCMCVCLFLWINDSSSVYCCWEEGEIHEEFVEGWFFVYNAMR